MDAAGPAARFRAAVEYGDMEAAIASLAEDVTFRSPVVHRPYEGREAVARILRAVARVFRDFRYTRSFSGAEAGHVLEFHARAGDRDVQGVDILRVEGDAITELVVMVRPLSGALALAEAMKAELERPAD